MCLTPRKIYTNAHYLRKAGYEPYQLEVKCGECTECIREYTNEWKLRTYYEYKHTLNKGGFLLFDCLTYAPKYLPKVSDLDNTILPTDDFSCLNRKNIREFLTRLNSNLKTHGYDKDNGYSHIICAEYGQDPKHTQRPHYHLLIFVKGNWITPVEMSKEIKKAWKYGTTSGVDDNEPYFKAKGIVKGTEAALKVADYIGKYCFKNQKWDKVASKKVDKIMHRFWEIENNFQEKENINIYNDPKWRKRKNDLLRNIKTFHVQSHHYGQYALKEKRNINISQDGFIGMPDTLNYWVTMHAPMYFQRKIWYNVKKDKYKRRYWEINEKGKAYKKRMIDKSIIQYTRRLNELEWYAQSELLTDITKKLTEAKSKIKPMEEWKRINDLLFAYRNNRNWSEYAWYKLYYKGRIIGELLYPEEIIEKTANKASEDTPNIYYNYCTVTDKDNLGKRGITTWDHGNLKKGYLKFHGEEKRPREFLMQYCINESDREIWQDFDKLSDLIETINTYKEYSNYKTWQFKKELKEKQKREQQTLLFN